MRFPLIFFVFCVAVILGFLLLGRSLWYPWYLSAKGDKTVVSVIEELSPDVRQRLIILFQTADMTYPPKEVAFLAIKDLKVLELWAKDNSVWKHITTYDIQAASGRLGPKLKEGDGQVPEGIYQIEGLNPNSAYHLSMKINYPNDFDLKWAKVEGRSRPGSDIFIHGEAVSVGCLAMGNEAIEELFFLADAVGIPNATVIIAPTDPRISSLIKSEYQRNWHKELDQIIESAFSEIVSGAR
ncbi:MAG: L,D-transpeptidase family protein [Candidatus Omnitrophica bacterium]|nr:L,D-transpeptidase family protein [Candidatus Omnitrophota bacterium]